VTTVTGSFTADAIARVTRAAVSVIDTESSTSPWVAGPIAAFFNSAAISLATGTNPPGFGGNSLLVDTSATTSDQMAYVPLAGTFKAGVAYTLTFWLKRATLGPSIQWIFGSKDTATDRSASGPQTVPNEWTKKTVTWTPSANRSDAVFAVAAYGFATSSTYIDGITTRGGLLVEAFFSITRASGFPADALFRARGFSSDALVRSTPVASFAASAIIGTKPKRVSIWIDGIDYTDHVIWATATFTARVNGSPGDCSFSVLDRTRSFTFTFGQEVNLFIDGVIRWGGWILRPQKTFALPVVPSPLTNPRTWVLEGVDYNAVFDKRIVHDLAKPDRVWDYAEGTYDDTIINNVWRYLDMEGFTKDIERVAPAVLDIPGSTDKGLVASGGDTFRDVLTAITHITAGIFYCTPDKVVTYCDSDKTSNPHILTDRPYAEGSSEPLVVWADTFSVDAALGMGSAYTLSSDDNDGSQVGHVAGGVFVLPGGGTFANYESYRGFPRPDHGKVQFDFFVPLASATGNNRPVVGVVMDSPMVPVEMYVRSSVGDGSWVLGTYWNTTDLVPDYDFTPDEETWYTAQLVYDAEQNVEMRVWKQGDPEPASPSTSGNVAADYANSPVNDGVPFFDFYYGMLTTDLLIDNFFIWDLDAVGYIPPPGAVGYREIKIRDDMTSMVNDALIWGVGYGSQNPVYARHQDEASQGAHGLWQAGEFKSGLYKQASANAIATQWVDGSPSSHRGAKKPKWSVELVTQSTAFSVGDVVTIENGSFDLTDMPNPLPVRQAMITFPTPTDPRFALTMTWEVDAAWSMFDPYKPATVSVPNVPCIGPDCNPIAGGDPLPCDSSVCGITDTFTRTEDGTWGTSDCGVPWTMMGPVGNGYWYVNGSKGVLRASSPDGPWWSAAALPITLVDFDATVVLQCNHNPDPADPNAGGSSEVVQVYGNTSGVSYFEIGRDENNSDAVYVMESHDTNPYNQIDYPDVTLTNPFAVRILKSGAAVSLWIWNTSETQPASPNISVTLASGKSWEALAFGAIQQALGSAPEPLELYVDSLDISGVNRCSESRFDNFNRVTTSPDVGVSDAGYTWTGGLYGATTTLNCDGSNLFFYTRTNSGEAEVALTGTGPWSIGSDFTFTARMQVNVSNAATLHRTLVFGLGAPMEFVYLWFSIFADRITMGAAGTVTSSEQTVTPVLPGDWFTLKWQHFPASTKVSRAKVWKDGAYEPDWLVTRSTVGDDYQGNTDEFSIYLSGLHTGWGTENGFNAFIDYIDFDYDGKPCYQDCGGGGITDTFNRSDGPVGISDAGIPWTDASAEISSSQLRIPTDGSSATLASEMPFPFFSSIEVVEQVGDSIGTVLVWLNGRANTIEVQWGLSPEGWITPFMRILVDANIITEWTGSPGEWSPSFPFSVEANINGTGAEFIVAGRIQTVSWGAVAISVSSVSAYTVGEVGTT
jgi:hypothetical protein